MAASGWQSEYVCSCPLLIVLIEVDNSHSVRDVYHAVAVHVGHADVDAAVVAAQVGVDDGYGVRHVSAAVAIGVAVSQRLYVAALQLGVWTVP